MAANLIQELIIRNLGQVDYLDTWSKMKNFTQDRVEDTPDEIWVLEHPAVFTLGQAGKSEHLLVNNNIQVVHCDRGGQITYHGPGQLVVYLLINLRRKNYSIRKLVSFIEQAIINTLKQLNIDSYSDPNAPGVYVDINNIKHKICSLGLRVKKGCTYHGLALNCDMDLKPFSYINPCGFKNLQVTQISALNPKTDIKQITELLCNELKLIVNSNQD